MTAGALAVAQPVAASQLTYGCSASQVASGFVFNVSAGSCEKTRSGRTPALSTYTIPRDYGVATSPANRQCSYNGATLPADQNTWALLPLRDTGYYGYNAVSYSIYVPAFVDQVGDVEDIENEYLSGSAGLPEQTRYAYAGVAGSGVAAPAWTRPTDASSQCNPDGTAGPLTTGPAVNANRGVFVDAQLLMATVADTGGTVVAWDKSGPTPTYTYKWSEPAVVTAEDHSPEASLIAAVMSTTTAPAATTAFLTAEAAYNALVLQSSKDALASALAAAREHRDALVADDAIIPQVRAAIADADAAATSTEAYAKLAQAETLLPGLTSSTIRSMLQGEIDAAKQRANLLAADESTAVMVRAHLADANVSTTAASANTHIAKAEVEWLTVSNARIKAALRIEIDAAIARSDALAADEAAVVAAIRAHIAAAYTATVSADAVAELDAAQAKLPGVSDVDTRATLQTEIEAARTHADQIRAAEDAANASRARAAIVVADAASVYADAIGALSGARGHALAIVDGNLRAQVLAEVDAAVVRAGQRLSQAELAAAIRAMVAEADAATSFAAAQRHLDDAQAALSGVTDGGTRATLRAEIDAARLRAESLRPGSSSNGGSSGGSSSTAGPHAASAGGVATGSDRAVSPLQRIADLAEAILIANLSDEVQLHQATIDAAEMNGLAKAHDAVMSVPLRSKVAEANARLAVALNAGDPIGTVRQQAVVGRGSSKAADSAHVRKARKVLRAYAGVAVLTTIAADRDWSPSRRAAYQRTMRVAAVRAGIKASDVRVVKPSRHETVRVYWVE